MSDLSFTLSNPAGTLGTPTASGQLATIVERRQCSRNVSGSPSRWLANGHISVTGNTVSLEAIGGGQPDQLILPSGTSFPNANASITGGHVQPVRRSGPRPSCFALSGVTATTTVTDATFSFGTGPDTFIPVPGPDCRGRPAGSDRWLAAVLSAWRDAVVSSSETTPFLGHRRRA